MNPEHEHAEHDTFPGGGNESREQLASARQEQTERLLERLFLSKRSANWRDLRKRESEESDPDDPSSSMWDVMPLVAREFQRSSSSEPQWEDLSVY